MRWLSLHGQLQQHTVQVAVALVRLRLMFAEADNTVRESKNQYLFRYWASWLMAKRARVVTQVHLQVGHTHDKLGGGLSD